MSVCMHTHTHICPSVKQVAVRVCFIKGALIWSLDYYFQWLAASGAAVKWKEQGSLLSERCALHLKGHVMFPGNWLNGFGFCNIRSGRFHSACVSWGTCLPVVFTLTSLPSPGDELGMNVCSLGLPYPCRPSVPTQARVDGCECSSLGSERLDLSASPSTDWLRLIEQEWQESEEVMEPESLISHSWKGGEWRQEEREGICRPLVSASQCMNNQDTLISFTTLSEWIFSDQFWKLTLSHKKAIFLNPLPFVYFLPTKTSLGSFSRELQYFLKQDCSSSEKRAVLKLNTSKLFRNLSVSQWPTSSINWVLDS